jgi:hypothetical protein
MSLQIEIFYSIREKKNTKKFLNLFVNDLVNFRSRNQSGFFSWCDLADVSL